MSSVCEKCGAKIPADARQGVCPACQLETGLSLLIHESVARGADSGRDDDVGGGDSSKVTRPARMLGDFGDYEVQEEIGRGGQGVVYRARQKSLNRTVALKVIGLGHWATEAHLKRFRREAEAAASLEHPCIVPIHEVGEREGSCYFSMKLIDGGQLDEVAKSATADSSCGERKPLSIRNAAELIAKLARAVHYAHGHGVLHRDIKPGNILVDTAGEPHLTDFGLARLLEAKSTITHTKDVLGTPSYMAPEQAVGNNAAVSNATDVYGLGAVFYQLLTGHPPFAGGTTYETIRMVLETEPRHPRLWNPKVNVDVATICLKCLEKDPKKRYETAEALAQDVERWLRHEPIHARRSGILRRGRKWTRRNPVMAVSVPTITALVAALAIILWQNVASRKETPTASLIPAKSVAVLPFANLSKDQANAFFADGIQDEILADLSKVADLKVISRTSVIKYNTDAARNLREIAKSLGVAHVVEGTVQRSGERVRVTAQLIDARNDTHLWADKYDRNLTDIFAVESEIATKIAETLQTKLTGDEKKAIASRPTENSEAHQLYLKGRYFWNKRTGNGLKKSIDYFNQAIAADPKYALAYAGLADAYVVLPFYAAGMPHDSYPKAKTAAKKALELDDTLSEAHSSLAMALCLYDFDFAQASKEFQRAIELNPHYATAHHWYATNVLLALGRFDDAIAELRRALEIDPLSMVTNTDLGAIYYFAHRYDKAIDQLRKTLEMDPGFYYTHWALGQALESSGSRDGAIAEYRKARELNDDPLVLALLGHAYAVSGNKSEALKVINELSEMAVHRYAQPYGFALVHLGLGDKEEAIRWLQKDCQDRGVWAIQRIRFDPFLDPLRGDPRFEKIVASLAPKEASIMAATGLAVLPFENLSDDKKSAFLADGIQDEILNNLAKISELRVISRESVMSYAGKPLNVPEIGRALDVTALLKGSVQRAGNRVRVSVQLINTTNGGSVWRNTYESEVMDLAALQRDLALQIASVLQARLSPDEIARLRRRPTRNGEAYLIYLQGQEAIYGSQDTAEDMNKAKQLFEKAIQLDPSFALAFAQLSYMESGVYHTYDSSPAQRAKALLAVNEALRLQPDLSEAHASLGYYYLWCENNYGRALAELGIAASGLPNDADIRAAIGNCERRQGKWKEAISDCEKAVALNPKDWFVCDGAALAHEGLHEFEAAARILDRAAAANPNFFFVNGERAFLDIAWKGDLTRMEQLLARTPENVDPDGQATLCRYNLKIFQRKYGEALQALTRSPLESFSGFRSGETPHLKSFLLAQVEQLMGDKVKARASFEEVRTLLESRVRQNPLDASQHSLLGQVYAALGRNDEAVAEGKRAVELMPESKDAADGPLITLALAKIYTMVGDPDSALPLLEHSLATPNGITVPLLKLDPIWDSLRGDPRFEKIVASLALK